MKRLLILVTLMTLTAACGKKQAPAGPQPPAPESKDETKPADGAGSGTEVTPAKRMSDPCEGGERK